MRTIRNSIKYLLVVLFVLSLISISYISVVQEGSTYFYMSEVKPKVNDPEEQKLVSYTNQADGYRLDVPEKMLVFTEYAPDFIKLVDDDLEIRISKETSPYADVNDYLNLYLYKYIMDYGYRTANDITLYKDIMSKINGHDARLVSFGRKAPEKGSQQKNQYFHAHIMIDSQSFYSIFIKTASVYNQKDKIEKILNSFMLTDPEGESEYSLQLQPELPSWNKETADFYRSLSLGKGVMWGVFYPHSLTKDFAYIDNIEHKLDYKFPLTLHYLYLGHDFPTVGMEKAYEKGKVVELTMQLMYDVRKQGNRNRKHNVNFDVMDGKYDAYIRQFARDAKAFGHPFIFRLNNEMNTTWTPYSGIALMCDPDNYIKCWRRIYDVFQQEGVKNAIWVFNPNDIDYPPFRWNSQVAYYPGNSYVQLIGLTGYNTGTYYANKTKERWRTFRQIYDPLNEKYGRFYNSFPWMITEFASSSVGGNKEKWIRDMFENIGAYRNLKAAVWWSYADFDFSNNKKTPARRYWLDEKPEYLEAFRKGLIKGTP